MKSGNFLEDRPSNATGYAKHYSRSRDAVIRFTIQPAISLRRASTRVISKSNSTALLMVQNRLRCGFAHVKLCAHLVEARCNRVNLLLKTRDGRFLLVHSSMCFEELVEQHRVHSVVADGISGRSSQKVRKFFRNDRVAMDQIGGFCECVFNCLSQSRESAGLAPRTPRCSTESEERSFGKF